jgi:hypothetical protein
LGNDYIFFGEVGGSGVENIDYGGTSGVFLRFWTLVVVNHINYAVIGGMRDNAYREVTRVFVHVFYNGVVLDHDGFHYIVDIPMLLTNFTHRKIKSITIQ